MGHSQTEDTPLPCAVLAASRTLQESSRDWGGEAGLAGTPGVGWAGGRQCVQVFRNQLHQENRNAETDHRAVSGRRVAVAISDGKIRC